MLVISSMREISNAQLGKIDGLERNYAQYYSMLALTLLPVPNIGRYVMDWLDNIPFEGVLLTGGNNISPVKYGQIYNMPQQSEERDETEYTIMDYAITKRIPILGICRGAQLINVYFGGRLTHETGNPNNAIQHAAKNHEVALTDNELVKILGETRHIVNSYHNQRITTTDLASPLKVFAVAKDNTIEGIYHPEHNLAGIMWHPERDSPSARLDNLVINLFRQKGLYWSR